MTRVRSPLLAAALIFSILAPLSVAAETDLPSERWYTERWCALQGGEIWVRMTDGGRCDCVTPTHAVEVSVAAEWADAIGWALRSAFNTGKQAGITLIDDQDSDALLPAADHFTLCRCGGSQT